MKDPTSWDRTLKQGRSRFCGAWSFYIFIRERWKEFPLVKGILHKCFLGIRKKSQHILIFSNGKYHKSHNMCKNTDICNFLMHFHNIFSYIFFVCILNHLFTQQFWEAFSEADLPGSKWSSSFRVPHSHRSLTRPYTNFVISSIPITKEKKVIVSL